MINKEQKEKLRELVERTSPDLNKLRKVRIDEQTVIYIDPKKDVSLAVSRWKKALAKTKSKSKPNEDTRDRPI